MRRVALILLYVCTAGFGDSLHLRVVVDASSPAEYNRWLWKHRAECPGIPPVLVTCDSMRHRNHYEWPAISFWTDSGPLLLHRVMPDSQSSILQASNYEISGRHDQLIMTEAGYNYAAYDRYGRRLFDDRENRLETGASGRWFRYVFARKRLEMLDDSGRVVSVLPSQYPARTLYAGDSVFAAYASSSLALFDRNGRTLWQSGTLRSPLLPAIADGGKAVAVTTTDSLVLHDLATGKTVVLPHDAAWVRYGWPRMTWSSDARLLAVYQGSKTSQDSGRVMVLDRSGKTVRPSRLLRAHQVRALLWLGDTLVLPGQDVDTAGMGPRRSGGVVTDSCLLTFVLPGGEQHQLSVRGKFGPNDDWRTSSPYLAYVEPPGRFMIAELVR